MTPPHRLHRTVTTLAAATLSAAALASAGTGAARADEHVAFITGGGPIAAMGGVLAYSTPGEDGRYRLMLSTDGGAGAPATGIAPSATPFDVALGQSGGDLVATYSRDHRAFVLPVAGGTERPMRLVTGPATTPVVSGDRVAWVIPGRGTFKGCDRLAVRSGKGRVRIVSRACRKLAGVQIHDKDVVWSSLDFTGTDAHGAGRKTSSIKAFRFGGGVRALDTTTFGEESNVLASPSIDGRDVVYTQSGLHPPKRFVRAALDGSGTPRRTAAGVGLGGPVAIDALRAYYVIPGRGEEGCAPGDGLAPVPCELVSASAAALAPGASRQLPPELSVAYTPAVKPPAGLPLGIGGILQRRTVRDGRTVSAAPLAGEVIDVLRRSIPVAGRMETFEPTGLSATTAADGTWSVTTTPPDMPFFSARVRSTGLLAGRGTVGYCPAGSTPLRSGGCSVPAHASDVPSSARHYDPRS